MERSTNPPASIIAFPTNAPLVADAKPSEEAVLVEDPNPLEAPSFPDTVPDPPDDIPDHESDARSNSSNAVIIDEALSTPAPTQAMLRSANNSDKSIVRHSKLLNDASLYKKTIDDARCSRCRVLDLPICHQPIPEGPWSSTGGSRRLSTCFECKHGKVSCDRFKAALAAKEGSSSKEGTKRRSSADSKPASLARRTKKLRFPVIEEEEEVGDDDVEKEAPVRSGRNKRKITNLTSSRPSKKPCPLIVEDNIEDEPAVVHDGTPAANDDPYKASFSIRRSPIQANTISVHLPPSRPSSGASVPAVPASLPPLHSFSSSSGTRVSFNLGEPSFIRPITAPTSSPDFPPLPLPSGGFLQQAVDTRVFLLEQHVHTLIEDRNKLMAQVKKLTSNQDDLIAYCHVLGARYKSLKTQRNPQ